MEYLRSQCWLSGTLRGAGPAEMLIAVELLVRGGSIDRVDATLDESAVGRLRDARLRP
jgi:hypothetical protein